MQEIEIEIKNDGKEKSQSWQLSVNIYLHKFDTDDEPPCVNSFTLANNFDMTMCDSSYESLMRNSFADLYRMTDKRYITEFQLKLIMNLLNGYKEDIQRKFQEGKNIVKINYYIDTTELSCIR